MNRKKRILIAPLNWGLGHASRCIPIIERFRALSAEVVLAADGRPYDFLKNEFPGTELHRLRDIDITYANGSSMLRSMLTQAPHLVASYLNERRSVDSFVSDLQIDGLVSDNRFGLYTDRVPCVYMTHQISIMPPALFGWTEPLLRRAHTALIRRFTECWIPDSPDTVNLSGSLSHGMPIPANTFFIGPQTRLRPYDVPSRYDCAVVLSGPEPQRTIFESLVHAQLQQLHLRAIIVQGKPELHGHDARKNTSDALPSILPDDRSCGTVDVVPSLAARELNDVMNASDCIVARSGYSTIMDLASIGKKAVLVPTPGQTEQEYLALRLKEMKIFYSEPQSGFRLDRALDQSRAYSGWTTRVDHAGWLDERIEHFLSLIPI